MRNARLGALVGIAACAIVLASCSSAEPSPKPTESISPTPKITLQVAADSSSQSQLLANLYVGALNGAGQSATVRTLASGDLRIPSVEKGDSAIVGESVTVATEFLSKQVNGPKAPVKTYSNLESAMNQLRDLASERKLAVLNPADASDQMAYAVGGKFAEEHGLTNLTGLAQYSLSNPVVLGGPAECQKDPLCLRGLEDTYGVKVRRFKVLDGGGPSITAALMEGEIDVGVVRTSDGVLSVSDDPSDPLSLVVLSDDQGLQPVGNFVPIVDEEYSSQLVRNTLNNFSARFTKADLQELDYAVVHDQQDPAQVADAWLAVRGLA